MEQRPKGWGVTAIQIISENEVQYFIKDYKRHIFSFGIWCLLVYTDLGRVRFRECELEGAVSSAIELIQIAFKLWLQLVESIWE
jgi:hypothetical protein